MASKIRLQIVLPITQVALTAVLTWWADHVEWMFFGERGRLPDRFVFVHLIVYKLRQIWVGINAPTYPFCFFSGKPIGWLLGFGSGELLYLGAVAVLWYLVGRFVDRWTCLEMFKGQRPGAPNGIVAMIVLGWGAVLLGVSAFNIEYSFPLVENHTIYWTIAFLARVRPEILARHILFLLWSVVLIAIPGTKLARANWPKQRMGRVLD